MRRKKMDWMDDYPVMLVKELDYMIMEVELYEGRIIIQPIYTAASAGEAELITKAIKELDPVVKYYVKVVERK
jgi:hypothetical protein